MSSAVVVASVMSFPTVSVGATETTTWTRVAGADRFATAAALATAAAPGGASTAVLVNGERTSDGLAAASLAGSLGAPILYVTRSTVPTSTSSTLDTLGVEQVVVVGGEAVVSSAVLDTIEASGIAVRRVAGPDRFATAAAVAREVPPTDSGVELDFNAFIVDSDSTDLAAPMAVVAYSEGTPILYVHGTEIPDSTRRVIGDLGLDVFRLVGDDTVVDPAIEAALAPSGVVRRIQGSPIHGIDAAMAFAVGDLTGFTTPTVVAGRAAATDVLAAVPLAVARYSPVVTTGGVSDFDADYVVGTVSTAVDDLVVVGGPDAVSEYAAENRADHAQLTDLSGLTGVQEYGVVYVDPFGFLRGIGLALPAGGRYRVDGVEVESGAFASALHSGLPFGNLVTYDVDQNLLTLTRQRTATARIAVAPFATDGSLTGDTVAVFPGGWGVSRLSRAMSMDIRLDHEGDGAVEPTRFETAADAGMDFQAADPADIEALLAQIAAADAASDPGCSTDGDLVITLEAGVTIVQLRPVSVCVAG